MIGLREFILPFVGGAGGTAYAQPSLEHIYLEGARAQGGIAGFMHPYQSAPRTPANAAATLIARRPRARPRRLLRHRRAVVRRAGLGGLLLPAAERRLPHAGDRRHGQLLRRLPRSAAGLGSHVRASDRTADAPELDRRHQARPHVLLHRAAAVPARWTAASRATRSRSPAAAPAALRVKADVDVDRAGRDARDSRERRGRADRARDRSVAGELRRHRRRAAGRLGGGAHHGTEIEVSRRRLRVRADERRSTSCAAASGSSKPADVQFLLGHDATRSGRASRTPAGDRTPSKTRSARPSIRRARCTGSWLRRRNKEGPALGPRGSDRGQTGSQTMVTHA